MGKWLLELLLLSAAAVNDGDFSCSRPRRSAAVPTHRRLRRRRRRRRWIPPLLYRYLLVIIIILIMYDILYTVLSLLLLLLLLLPIYFLVFSLHRHNTHTLHLHEYKRYTLSHSNYINRFLLTYTRCSTATVSYNIL